VTPDEVPDPQALALHLSVNGVVRQNGSTADTVFSVDYLVWYIRQFMVLEPGDLINTGTPAGVSMGTTTWRTSRPATSLSSVSRNSAATDRQWERALGLE
jgi:2-keto-4-pentenoate hydratase/2-oxohepta-3-ene-1,7-dioic acid hydratase in catechol pathway